MAKVLQANGLEQASPGPASPRAPPWVVDPLRMKPWKGARISRTNSASPIYCTMVLRGVFGFELQAGVAADDRLLLFSPVPCRALTGQGRARGQNPGRRSQTRWALGWLLSGRWPAQPALAAAEIKSPYERGEAAPLI